MILFTDIFGCLFDSIILIIFYDIFLKRRFEKRISTITMIVVIFLYIWITGDIIEKYYLGSWVVMVGDFLIAVLFYQGKFISKVFCVFILNLASYISDMIAIGMMMITEIQLDLLMIDSNYRTAAIFISKFILLIIAKIISRIGNKEGKYAPKTYWLLLIFIFISGLILLTGMVYFIYYQDKRLEAYLILMLSIYVLSNAVIVMGFFEKIAQYITYKYKYSVIEKQVRMQEEYYETIRTISHETHKLKHDMKNHILCIAELMEKGENDEAKEYTDKITKEIETNDIEIKTGNIPLDAILNHKYKDAKNKKINIEVDVKIGSKFKIESVDLCIVSGNALDNAIEACEKVDDVEARKIILQIAVNEKFYIMKIKNTFKANPVRDGYYYKTNKENKLEHGFGIGIMEKTVAKYSGDISIEHDEKEFEVTVLMNNQ